MGGGRFFYSFYRLAEATSCGVSAAATPMPSTMDRALDADALDADGPRPRPLALAVPAP
jgi:hypothetical protein